MHKRGNFKGRDPSPPLLQAGEKKPRIFTSSSSSNPTALLLLLLLHPTAASALGHHLLLHHVNDFVGDPQVFDGAAADVALWHPPELVPVLLGSNT